MKDNHIQRKECCALARQRSRTAPERAARARSAATPLVAFLAQLEGILIVSLASTYLRALGSLAGGLVSRQGEGKPPAPAQVTATRSAPPPPPPPVRKLLHGMPSEYRLPPRFPLACYEPGTAGADALKAWHAKNAQRRQEEATARFGYPNYMQALHDIVRNHGKPKRMVAGRNPWKIVSESDYPLARYIASLGHDPTSAGWVEVRGDISRARYAPPPPENSFKPFDDVPGEGERPVLPSKRKVARRVDWLRKCTEIWHDRGELAALDDDEQAQAFTMQSASRPVPATDDDSGGRDSAATLRPAPPPGVKGGA